MDTATYLKSKGMKEKSINIYISIIDKLTAKLGKSFTEKELEDCLAAMNIKPSTYNLYRAVMGFYTKKELGYQITFSKAKKNDFLPVEVTKEEFNRFLDTIPNIKHKIGFRLMYESGLRVNEVVTVKKHDFNIDKLTVRIRGKGEKDRYTILNNGLADMIKIIETGNPYFFEHDKGHLTAKTFQERLKKGIIDARLSKKFTCHSLRHSFSINLLNMGIDLDIVRQLLGHSSIRTTQIYLKCRTVNLTKIANLYTV